MGKNLDKNNIHKKENNRYYINIEDSQSDLFTSKNGKGNKIAEVVNNNYNSKIMNKNNKDNLFKKIILKDLNINETTSKFN